MSDVLTQAEIDSLMECGMKALRKKSRRRKEREYRRDECHYSRYADDWEREGDD